MRSGRGRLDAPRGWGASWLLLRKELREASRDRALLAQLILVPLFLYPLLGMLGYQIYLVSQGVSEKKEVVVWMDAAAPDSIRAEIASQPHWTVDTPGIAAPRSAAEARRLFEAADPSPAAWLVWTAEAGRDSARILYDGSSEIGRRAEQQLRETVTDFGEELRWRRARDWGWTHADLQVFDLEREEVSGGSEFVGWILSMILPVVLMVMLPQGAYYSTLDTIVGERERGTWETLLTSSLDSSEIVRGKFGYVVLWSLVSTLLNLVGMLLFLWAGAEILGLGDRLTVRLEWAPMLVALAGVILFAVAIAAVMILVALPARSYREGQAALSPVYLVSAFGAMLAVTGSETLTYVQAAIPVVNVAALLRGSLRGELPAGPTLVALLSLAVVAWVAVRWAARVLGDEDTYFSEGLSLRSLLRKRSEPR